MKTKILTALMLALSLTACGNAADNDKTDNEGTASVAASSEGEMKECAVNIQAVEDQAKEADKFYPTEGSEGYRVMKSGDGRFTVRFDYEIKDGEVYYKYAVTNDTDETVYIEPAHLMLVPYINDCPNGTGAVFTMEQVVATLGAGETYEQQEQKTVGLKDAVKQTMDGSHELFKWNADGDNSVKVIPVGTVAEYEKQSGDKEKAAYGMPYFTDTCGSEIAFTFDGSGTPVGN